MKFRLPSDPLDYKPDWEKMSKMQKAGYIWDYYKIPILILLVILYFIGYAGYRYAVRTYPVLYVDAVNLFTDDEVTSFLTDGYKEAAGLKPREVVEYQSGLLLTADMSSPYYGQSSAAAQVKVLASITAHQLDIVLMDREAFDIFAQEGSLHDLEALMASEEITEQQKELLTKLSPRFAANTAGPQAGSTQVDGTQAGSTQDESGAAAAEEMTEEEMAAGEEHMFAIELSGTKLDQTSATGEPLYLGILVNTPRMDTVLSWVDYLYS